MPASKLSCYVIILITLNLLTSSCSVVTIADHMVPKKPQNLPSDVVLEVPFFEQTDNHCGPASLAMVAAYYDHDVDIEALSKKVYTPKKAGSLQIEMQAAARSLGFVVFTTTMDLASLSLEIDSGHPVIVLQNLSLSIYPVWHYAVVTGRDVDRDHFLMHSGQHEYYRSPWYTLENTWARSDYWSMILLPVGQLPASIPLSDALTAAVDLENIGEYRAAQLTYQAINERWPDSFAALAGIANTHMYLKEPIAASRAYKQALKFNNQSAELLNNFAYNAQALGCEVTAIKAVECALKMNPEQPQSILDTLEQLQSSSPHPSNHNYCPTIHCSN